MSELQAGSEAASGMKIPIVDIGLFLAGEPGALERAAGQVGEVPHARDARARVGPYPGCPGALIYFNPHAGGVKITAKTRLRTVARIERFASRRYRGKYTRLEFRFRGALCYVDAYTEPEKPSRRLLEVTGETREQFLERLRNAPVHLCRLRHFAEDRWSLAFYTYSNERYEPCVFLNGSFFGTPEEAFELCAGYLG